MIDEGKVELPERGGGAAAGLVRGDQLRLVVGAADVLNLRTTT